MVKDIFKTKIYAKGNSRNVSCPATSYCKRIFSQATKTAVAIGLVRVLTEMNSSAGHLGRVAFIANTKSKTPSLVGSRTLSHLHNKEPSILEDSKRQVEEVCQELQRNQNFYNEMVNGATTMEVQINKLFPEETSSPGPFSMILYRDNDAVSNSIRRQGFHDLGQTTQMAQAIRTYAANHDISDLSQLTILDIGAQIGWFTLGLASMGVNVVAFEPMSQNRQLLRTSLCLNDPGLRSRVTLIATGLSNQAESCTIMSAPDNVGDGQVHCQQSTETNAVPEQARVSEEIHLVRLDDIMQQLETDDNPNPLFRHVVAVKMDTEGNEPKIIEGGKAFFQSHRVPSIFSEFSADMMRQVGANGLEMMTFLVDQLGYTARENRHHHWKRLGRGPLSRDVVFDMTNFEGLHDIAYELPPGRTVV